jgi:hypothetical protein
MNNVVSLQDIQMDRLETGKRSITSTVEVKSCNNMIESVL